MVNRVYGRLLDLTGAPRAGIVEVLPLIPSGTAVVQQSTGALLIPVWQSIPVAADGSFVIATVAPSDFSPAGLRLRVRGPSGFVWEMPFPASAHMALDGTVLGGAPTWGAPTTVTVSGQLESTDPATMVAALDTPPTGVVFLSDHSVVVTDPVMRPAAADGSFRLPLLPAAALTPPGVRVRVGVNHRQLGWITVPSADAALSALL